MAGHCDEFYCYYFLMLLYDLLISYLIIKNDVKVTRYLILRVNTRVFLLFLFI